MTTDPRARQTRLASGVTRARLLALLRESDRDWSIPELATELQLHPNTVREQVERLVETRQLVRVSTSSPPTGRGRPAHRYRATPEVDAAAPYRELARMLSEELARVPGAAARAVSAGERWGRSAVRSGAPADAAIHGPAPAAPASPDPDASPIDRLLVLLEEGGFAPEPVAPGQPIRLRRCPFAPLADEQRGVVCGVHLGLMRGALDELGAPFDAVRLEPFVEPDLCLAHLGPREPARQPEP